MLICSAALSSTINSRLRRGLAYSLISDSAAATPSVVVGLLTKENAPRASACWRSSSSVMICTGMWRVSGLCLSWLSTVQPRRSGKKHSREIDQDARIMRVVLHDQQDGVAGFEIEPVVGQLLDHARFLRRRLQGRDGGILRRCRTDTRRQ